MTEKLFLEAINKRNTQRPPVWFMRQAGRYHEHYQQIRARHSFEEMCYNSDLAAEIAIAPVLDLKLDCAILFSDILFILKAMSHKVSFSDSGPSFDFYLTEMSDFEKYKAHDVRDVMGFQQDAIKKTTSGLPSSITMLGFVGGIATLFKFASKSYESEDMLKCFAEKLVPCLVENIKMQADSGVDVVCILDSSLNVHIQFSAIYQKILQDFLAEVKSEVSVPIMYYLKGANSRQLQFLESCGVSCVGIDESMQLQEAFESTSIAIEGNFLNDIVTMPEDECLREMEKYFAGLKLLSKESRSRYINTLSHGVMKNTKIENLRNFMQLNSSL